MGKYTYEIFLSLVRYFLVFVVVNNLLWGVVYVAYTNKAYDEGVSSIVQTQEGTNNVQEMLNEADSNSKDKENH